MINIILVVALLYAVSKWIMFKLSTAAILLYFAESGVELPDVAKIREYQLKVAMKSLGIKEG